MDIGPIPLSEILAFLELYEIEGLEERHRYLRFVRSLDNHYLSLVHEDRERKSKAKQQHGGLSSRPRNRG